VFTLPSSMHTYTCEAPCVQVDLKPERASVDFGFKIKLLFLFSAVFVRACMRTCMYACARARTCFLVIRRIHALYMHACIYIYIYIYIYVYIYIYIFTYIHIYIYIHTIYTHKTHACIVMMHAQICAFHLRTCMHTGCHIPTCYTRGASRHCVVRCHIRRRQNHCKRRY
jgi:hypothetical protein